ncbi:hypothetical protein Tco_0980536 [Tanacetum coccineum]
MKKIKKSHPEGDSTSFDDLPDDLTVLQVEVISFTSVTHPLVHPANVLLNDSIFYTLLRSFQSAMLSLKKFTRVKSLCIQLLSSFDNPLLFKWKIKFGNQLDTLLFLSHGAIYHNQILHDKENSHEEYIWMKRNIMLLCWMDAMFSHDMLLCSIEKIPTLENISITDSGKRRIPYETIEQRLLNCKNVYHEAVEYYVPLLKLPISGYVMKGVTLILSERHNPHDEKREYVLLCIDYLEIGHLVI